MYPVTINKRIALTTHQISSGDLIVTAVDEFRKKDFIQQNNPVFLHSSYAMAGKSKVLYGYLPRRKQQVG